MATASGSCFCVSYFDGEGEMTMYHSGKTVLAVGIFLLTLPCYLNAQQPAPSGPYPFGQQPKPGEPGAASPKLSEPSGLTGSPNQTQQSNTLVSAQALTNSKVLDADSRELGSVKNIMVDPTSGKLVRADISLGRGGVLGMGDGDQRFSVPWEQLALKRQGDKFVFVLSQQFVDTIKTEKEKQTNQKRAEQNPQQRPAETK
jgi:sporulation protein YlmC with PRC-barrel domain